MPKTLSDVLEEKDHNIFLSIIGSPTATNKVIRYVRLAIRKASERDWWILLPDDTHDINKAIIRKLERLKYDKFGILGKDTDKLGQSNLMHVVNGGAEQPLSSVVLYKKLIDISDAIMFINYEYPAQLEEAYQYALETGRACWWVDIPIKESIFVREHLENLITAEQHQLL